MLVLEKNIMINIDMEKITAKWNKDYDKPIVTVVCNTYNHEKYVRRALEGFLIQETSFPFEVIVQDDASTDCTADIIREYEEKYSRIIRPIYEKENLYSKHDGSWTRSILPYLTGKYVAYCEGDDYWTDPHKLQSQVDIMEKHPEYTICFNRVQFVNEDESPCHYTAPPKGMLREGTITLKRFIRENFRNGYWVFQTSSFLLRNDVKKWYDNNLQEMFDIFPCDDLVIVLACLMKGKGYYLDRTCGCYRKTLTGATRSTEKEALKEKQHWMQLNKGVEYFDRITHGKYHGDIMFQVRLGEFKIDVLNRKLGKVLFAQKYKNYIGFRVRIGGVIRIISGKMFYYLREKVGRLR